MPLTPCPKPPRREKRPRKPLRKQGRAIARKTPVKKVNVERQAKRKAGYAKKLQAYRRSRTYKDVEARSGGRCEARVIQYPFRIQFDVTQTLDSGDAHRCARRASHHHHLNYKNFGGSESPAQMVHLCAPCHQAVEAIQHPTRRRWREYQEGK